MPTKSQVLWSLLLLQCTLGQCTESRLDGCGPFSNIPAELLALKNYGAMDFLSSPMIESIKPAFPSTLVPEVACENPFVKSNPYTFEVTNFEIPGASVSLAISSDLPYVISEVIPQSAIILDTPVTPCNAHIEPITNNPMMAAYELNPYTVSLPNCPVSNLYVEEAPVIFASPPSFEVPVLSNFVDPYVSPVANTLNVLPTILSPILEVPSNSFYVPAIEVSTIPQASPASRFGSVFDVLSPILRDVPVAFEPPVFVNSYTGPTSLAVELPVVRNIPTYIKPQIPASSLSSESIATSIANIRSIFPSLPTLPPGSRVRNTGGIAISELSASRSNGLFVSSSSPKGPSGISIRSENTYQGPVSVAGKLPFLGTVGFSGSVPSSGYGTVNYRCGSGNVEMLSEAPNILNNFFSRP